MLWEVFFIHLDEGEGNKHNTAKHTQNDKSTVDPKINRVLRGRPLMISGWGMRKNKKRINFFPRECLLIIMKCD